MNTTSQSFFEEIYRQNHDPWHFASSSYELDRYGAIASALSGKRYSRAFEPACSIGVLTARLSCLCDQVVAMDISPTAVATARTRCESLKNVSIYCASLADQIPESFDLLVFAEVGYYFPREKLHQVLMKCLANLSSGGTLLACHWLGSSPDHILSGDTVHETIGRLPGLRPELSERQEHFRLDRWINHQGVVS